MNTDELRQALLDQERFAPMEHAVLDELATLTRPRRHLPGWSTGLLAAAAVVAVVAGVSILASPTTTTPGGPTITTATALAHSTPRVARTSVTYIPQLPTSVDPLEASRAAQARRQAEDAELSAETAASSAEAAAKAAAAMQTPTPEGPQVPSSARAVRPPDCTTKQLTASEDDKRSGPAAGAENVVILLHNISRSTCWLGGVPTLRAVSSRGIQVLPFRPSADPAVAAQGPAVGPGPLPPGATGAVHLTMQLNNCHELPPQFNYLLLGLPSSQTVRLAFPPQMSLTGCYGNVAEAGPIPAS